MRFQKILAVLAAGGALFAADAKKPVRSPDPFNIPLWERSKIPLAKGEGPLDEPFLTAFLPPEGKRNGSAVIIAPGGGNIMMMYGVEGFEAAERFNEWGAAAFVLTYRLNPYGDDARELDGVRAMRLVRSRAKDWGVDPAKVGFGGFSAGSALARLVAAQAKPGDPNAADPIDRQDSRPAYLVMVYSAGQRSPGEDLKTFPPTFLLSAAFDRGPANGSAQLFLDLNKAGAVAELHIYQKGRHGFGAGDGSPEFSPWMGALKHFLQIGGFLPAGN